MSSIDFLYIPSSNQTSKEFDSIRRKHLLDMEVFDNNFYLTKIFDFLCSAKKNINVQQKQLLRKQKEEEITDYIRRRLQQDEDFNLSGFLVDTEARNQDKVVGYYDLKFQHSDWINEYLVIECKPVDLTKSRIDSYIHKKTNSKEDGGLYRFFINKYATNKTFGGMLGYIVNGVPEDVTNKLKEEISRFQLENKSIIFGKIIDEELLESKVAGFEYSFQSNHIRAYENKVITPIHIFHLFFNFT